LAALGRGLAFESGVERAVLLELLTGLRDLVRQKRKPRRISALQA
jgi:hypothetical protein